MVVKSEQSERLRHEKLEQSFPAIQVIATSGSFSGNEVPGGVLADAFYSKGTNVSAIADIADTCSNAAAPPGPNLS